MKLAINGGPKVREKLFPAQLTIGKEEEIAVLEVMKDQRLSFYRGNAENFKGGPKIQEFESALREKFEQDAIAINSCTSALIVACGAIGLQPGDEVIVTPWSMSCSATAPMFWGATPVFADISTEDFQLDIQDVENKITSKTKAIIAVSLFGQPIKSEFMDLANRYGLYLVEDAAQSIGARKPPSNSFTGHLACLSFTQGKHLTSGEGGAIMINHVDEFPKTGSESASCEEIADKCRMILNHAEAVMNDMSDRYKHLWPNMVGMNLRMTEIQAAIMVEQLKKLDHYVEYRQINARKIYDALSDLPFIIEPKIRNGYTHSFYVQPFLFDWSRFDFDNNTVAQAASLYHNPTPEFSRDPYINAVKAELTGEEVRIDKGVAINNGYIKPLYLFPLFQEKAHWTLEKGNYSVGTCPNAENLNETSLFVSLLHGLPLEDNDIQDISDAFHKVYENRGELG